MAHRLFLLGALGMGLMGTLASSGAARAADLDEPSFGAQPVPEDKVEFGSGWYIRGDLGATRVPKLDLTPSSTVGGVPTPPTVTFGNGSTLGYVASLGGGYQIFSWLRADVTADFNKPVSTTSTSGNGNIYCPTGVSYPDAVTVGSVVHYGDPRYSDGGCTGTYVAKLSSYDVLVNGYVDLGTWYHVTPYVGAGVGLGFGHYQTSATYVQANGVPYQVSYADPKFNATFYQNFDRHSSGTYYNFAYALMAGVGIDVYDHTKLDIGYRYINLGKVDGVSSTLYAHQIRAGIRYAIDD